MSIKQAKIWKFFSSIKLAIWLLSIIATLSLIGTFIPQNEEPAYYASKYGQVGLDVLTAAGLNNIYGSWWFILSLILFSLNLTVCFLNRFSLKVRSIGTMMAHFSVLVILLGALIGMLFGQKGYIKIAKGDQINSFLTQNRRLVNLGFSIKLDDFIYTEHIDPKEKLLICTPEKQAVCNLGDASAPDKAKGIIAQMPTEVGSESDIANTGYRVKVLRYLPDFVMDTATKSATTRSAVPNNPALEVELSASGGKDTKKYWVFARYPDVHQEIDADFRFVYNWAGRRPKDFISKVTILKEGKEVIKKDIRVNVPFRFGGYAFFQSSYDAESLSWSGLQVVKDPGVPVVYLGFVLLIFGLMTIFYVNPMIRRG